MSENEKPTKEITLDLDPRTWATLQYLAEKAGVKFEEFVAEVLEEQVRRKLGAEEEPH